MAEQMINPDKLQGKDNLDSGPSKGKAKKASTSAYAASGSSTVVMGADSRSGNKPPQKGHSINTPSPPTVTTFNAEALSILREMNASQSRINEKVESLALKVDELYNYENENY